MAQPSSIQVLGGPLGGQRVEFGGGDVFIGSAPDCTVRLDAPGVELYHARIVIDITGATIYSVDGVLGVNDDVVTGDVLLRSGDFVWIGEPGGDSSMMLQFTLGDVGDSSLAAVLEPQSAEPLAAMAGEDMVSDDPVPEEARPEPGAVDAASNADVMEMSAESLDEELMVGGSPVAPPPSAVESQESEFEAPMGEVAMGQPGIDELTRAEAPLDEPAPDEPAPDEPAPDEPAPDEPAPDEPAPDEPAPDEPAPDEPAPDEPAVAEPAISSLPLEEPTEQMTLQEQPADVLPAAPGETEAASPVEPVVEEPAMAEPPPDEPTERMTLQEQPAELMPAVPAEIEAASEPQPVPEEPAMAKPPRDEPTEQMTPLEQLAELLPAASAAPAGTEAAGDAEPGFEQTTEIPSSLPSLEVTKVVPPAPWQLPMSSTPEPAAATEYASAWESKPATPVSPEPAPVELVEETPAAPPAVAPRSTPPVPPATGPLATKRPGSAPLPPVPPATGPLATKRPGSAPLPPVRATTVPPAAKRPGSVPPTLRPRVRPADQGAAPRMPARTTSNTPLVIGGLVAVLFMFIGGYFLTRPATPLAPPPTPTPVAVSTPEAPPEPTFEADLEPTPEGTEAATVEPTPEVSVPPVTAVATPRVAPTPVPRATPAPRATPPPRATPATAATRPAGPAPTAAPVSQAPRLLAEARAAVAARDLPKASQLLDQVLRLEPGNGEATTQKAEVTARLASLNRKFSVGRTSVRGGKAAQGPAGFDLGGAGVVQTDFSAQIRCTTTPASLEPGMAYTVSCTIVNIGAKAFRLDNVAVNETLDGAKSSSAGTAPRGDIAPQANGAILQRSGTWSAKTRWSIEIIAKTNEAESFRAVYTWR